MAASWAKRAHAAAGADCVLHAAVFEAIFPEVNDIAIPAWVFEDLGQVVEKRHFQYEDMLGGLPMPDQAMGGSVWSGGGVPDLTQAETQRWFYYRSVRYFQCGFEAIHLGQIHLVAGLDRNYQIVSALCQKIRQAATIHARRGWVILDAHSHGIAYHGSLLFDFTSRPLSSRGLVDREHFSAIIKRGPSLGGVHPGGWVCDESPTLVERDNWGGYSMDPESADWANPHKRASAGLWGYDQCSWYARHDISYRHDFLRHTHRWTRMQGAH